MKICGVTRPADAALACELGADAVGVVFAERSRRQVTLAQAGAIRAEVRGLSWLVALFVDAAPAQVREVIDAVRPDLLQFHGGESASWCEQFRWPYAKALSHAEFGAQWADHPGARLLVIDSHAPGQLGGSGKTFDWSTVPGDIGKSLLLAGGLSPDNVGAAIRKARPYGVDVASGVESVPGVKDRDRMIQFIEEVARVDSDQPGP